MGRWAARRAVLLSSLNTMPGRNQGFRWGAALVLPIVVLPITWVLWSGGIAAAVVGPTAVLVVLGFVILGFAHVVEFRRRGRAEFMARASMRRYQLLAEHSSDMIVSFDPRTQQ